MVSVDSAYIEGVREWLLAAIAKHIADISSGDQLVGNFCCAEFADISAFWRCQTLVNT
jgi:hypothetical protein